MGDGEKRMNEERKDERGPKTLNMKTGCVNVTLLNTVI